MSPLKITPLILGIKCLHREMKDNSDIALCNTAVCVRVGAHYVMREVRGKIL
jgi:hypothetical protein